MERKCRGCGATKPVGDFPKDASKRDGIYTQCKECKQAKDRARKRPPGSDYAAVKRWRAAHPEEAKAAQRKYYREHREEILAYRKRWLAERKERDGGR